MLLTVVLSLVLVGLPAVLATPAQVIAPAQVSQGSPLAFIPAAIERAYEYSHQFAQWTLGRHDDHGTRITPVDPVGPPGYCWPHGPHHPHERVVVNKTIYEFLSGESRYVLWFSSTFGSRLIRDQVLETLQAHELEQRYHRSA
jgi:hypothetical protein